jgi:octopine/nopaline transport system substrate-binding protein
MALTRFGCVVAVLAALAAGIAPAHAQDRAQVEVGVEGAFPPWNNKTADGQLVGLDIDLVRDLCRRAALRCDLVANDWAGLIPALNAGKFDMVLSVGINEARRKVVDFTVPYASGAATFLILKDGAVAAMPMTGTRLDLNDKAAAAPVMARIHDLLRGKTVGVVQSSSHEQLIRAFFGDDVDVRTYRGSAERDLDLRAGRIDAGFDSAVYATSLLGQPDSQDLQMTGPLMKGAMLATEVAIALRKDEPDLKAKLDAAITAAAQDGTIRRISEQWSKLDLTPSLQ